MPEQTDHDLLIRLDQKVSDIQNSVKELQDGTFSKITCLEKDKAERVDVELLRQKVNKDIEIRVRSLEGKIIYVFAFSTGAGVMVSLVASYLMK